MERDLRARWLANTAFAAGFKSNRAFGEGTAIELGELDPPYFSQWQNEAWKR